MADMRSSDGFTLAEVMTAVLIFSVGMLGVATMLTTSINSDSYNSDVRGAEFLAKSKLEELRARTPAERIAKCIAGTPTVNQEDPADQRKYCLQWTIESVDCSVCGTYTDCLTNPACQYPISTVTVDVGWPRGGAGGACTKTQPRKCPHSLRLEVSVMHQPCPICCSTCGACP
jgi:prepilin-type N-terminal cleavage/methylation domain-containing protein